VRKNPTASYSRWRRSAGSQPGTSGPLIGSGANTTAEQFGLAARRGGLRALRGRQHDVDRGGRPCPFALKLVERPAARLSSTLLLTARA